MDRCRMQLQCLHGPFQSCTANDNQNECLSSHAWSQEDKITHNSTTRVSFSTTLYFSVSATITMIAVKFDYK